MSGSKQPATGFAGKAGRVLGHLFFIGLFVAWFAAVQVSLDNVNEGMGWVVDKVITWVTPTPAGAAERTDKYAAPSEGEFFAKLIQPDNTTSCCGAADAYWADETEACKPEDGPACWVRAVITDTRPDTFMVTDAKGVPKEISRPHLDVGTRIVVPFNKKRKLYSENPTDHGIIFVANPQAFDYYESGAPAPAGVLTPNSYMVYCFEPLSGL